MDQDWTGLRSLHLAETGWLAERMAAGDTALRIVDMRGYVRTETRPDGSQTADYLGAPEEYAAAHIPGAIYLDWTRDIVDEADPVPAQIAGPDKIESVLGRAGIGSDSLVVVYDNHAASQFATRLWWVLRAYGHRNVRVLNGGWAKWTRENRPVTNEAPRYLPAVFTARADPEWRITAGELRDRLGDPNLTLLDLRDEGQYTGRIRRGPRGGHIPGASHLPREAFFNSDGTFRTPTELQQITSAAGAMPDTPIVAYCNGGVAATSALFALSMLGYSRLANYDGSWNEWSAREDLPIE